MATRTIRFSEPWKDPSTSVQYAVGQVLTLDASIARGLISAGWAVPSTDPVTPSPDPLPIYLRKTDAAAAYEPLILPESVLWAMGDSEIANGWTAPTTTAGPFITGQSILMWASVFSGGKFRFGGIAATGGFTTTQVLATHLPTVIAARPTACLVLCGTNDTPIGITNATTKANLLSIWTQLTQAGIRPILTTLLPRADLTAPQLADLQRLNYWIARQGRLNGWPVLDAYAATADPATGTYLSGYNVDSVHPNTKGAQAIGQALANMISTVLRPTAQNAPPLARASTWPNLTNAAETNALNLASAAGVPTGWARDVGSADTPTVTALSAPEIAAGGVGNWFNIARSGVTVGYRTSGNTTLVAGNRMAWGMRFKTSGLAAGGQPELRLIDTSGIHYAARFQITNAANAPASDVANGVFWLEFDVPPLVGNGQDSTFKQVLQLPGADHTLSATQFTLIDLTAAGIYP